MFSHVIRKTANKDNYIIYINKLVYQLYLIKMSKLVILIWNATV